MSIPYHAQARRNEPVGGARLDSSHGQAPAQSSMTYADYLLAEADSPVRHEYVGVPPFSVSCQTAPSNANFPDYLGHQCSGTLTNRATEYDWLRFFWDLDYDQGLSTTTIYTIWDWANSDNWHASGDGWDTYSTSTPCSIWTGSAYMPPSWPSGRLRCAADTAGYLTEWDAEDAANGVHR